MQYTCCKCGKHECWTSMGHPSCDVCSDCGSTLGYGENTYPESTPHEVYASIQQGKLEARCARCHRVCNLKDAKNLNAVRAEVDAIYNTLHNK